MGDRPRLHAHVKNQGNKRVLAFYYGWYGTPQVSREWRHWNAGGLNPDKMKNGKREIASAHEPKGDVYDSSDEEIILRHLELAQNAGIDALVVSWWGGNTFEEKNLLKMMDVIEKKKIRVRVAVYVEAVPQYDEKQILPMLQYIVKNFTGRKSYFTTDNGKPVIFVYGRAIFPSVFCMFEGCEKTPPEKISWNEALVEIKKEKNVFVVADAVAYTMFNKLPDIAAMGFDGAHVYNPHLETNMKLNMAKTYKNFVKQAEKLKLLPAVTVIPGYDDRWSGRKVASVTERNSGKLYSDLWDDAISSGAPWVLITSFNEWHEGSEIEPSMGYGDTYLKLTKEKVSKFLKNP